MSDERALTLSRLRAIAAAVKWPADWNERLDREDQLIEIAGRAYELGRGGAPTPPPRAGGEEEEAMSAIEELLAAVDNGTTAPSGVAICACSNRNAVAAGMKPMCWSCELRCCAARVRAEMDREPVEMSDEELVRIYWKHANRHLDCCPDGLLAVAHAVRARMGEK